MVHHYCFSLLSSSHRNCPCDSEILPSEAQGKLQISRKIFLFLHMRPEKHLALRPYSRMGISTHFAAGCSVLHWCDLVSARDSALDTATPCVQRISSVMFVQQSHWRALERGALLSTQAAPAASGRTESSAPEDGMFHLLGSLCSMRCHTWHLPLSYLICRLHCYCRLESADLISMWCLHTLLITLGITSLPYLGSARYMKVSHLPSASLLLPSFVGSSSYNFYIFFP